MSKGSPDSDCTETLLAFGGGDCSGEIDVATTTTTTRTGLRQDFETETFVTCRNSGCGFWTEDESASPLGCGSRAVHESTLVAHTLRGEGFDGSEDGSGRGIPLVPMAFDWGKSGSRSMGVSLEVSSPLRAHHSNHPAIAFKPNQSAKARSLGLEVENAPTLGGASGGNRVPAVAFTERTRAEGRTLEYQEDLAYALTNPGSGGRTHSRSIMQGLQVRRLTPTECERLQGLPDDWTAWGVNEHGDRVELSDSARYKMVGNGVGLPVVAWIGRRIASANLKQDDPLI